MQLSDQQTREPVQIRRWLTHAQRRLLRLEGRLLQPFQLTPPELECLMVLCARGPLRMRDLADETLLTKSNLTRIVKALEQRRLVRRERSPRSNRETIAQVTEEGRRLCEEACRKHEAELCDYVQHRLTPEELVSLLGLLRKLTSR